MALTQEQKVLLDRMVERGFSIPVMADIIAARVEDVHLYLAAQRALVRKAPNLLSTAYLVKRLQQGYTVKDIAKEIGCGSSSIYRILKQRGVNVYAYTKLSENGELVGVHLMDQEGGNHE